MADLYEIKTFWSAENSPGGESIMYFRDGTATLDFLRQSINVMYTSVATRFDSLTTWSVAQSGNIVDEATGTLVDEWSSGNDYSGNGSASGQPVPNEAQLLIRWNPQVIIGGRRLKGRTYVPGLSSLAMDAGHVSSAVVGDFQAAAEQFIDDCATQFVTWRRPVEGAGGASASVITASIWNEWAVQRRRR